MAAAAATTSSLSLSLSSSRRRASASLSILNTDDSSSLRPIPFFLSEIRRRTPGLRVSPVSMSVRAPEKQSTSQSSFIDRRESGLLHFVKYHGLGNDFILVDNRDSTEPKITPEQAVRLCDRNFGVGVDGVIFALPGINGTDYTMRIFNSDGSEPEMCGNGVRCFARFIVELENLPGRHSFTVHSGDGLIVPEIQDVGQVKVDMGEPILKAIDIPTKIPSNKDVSVVIVDLDVDDTTWSLTCLSMGNPHCVTFGRKGEQILNYL